MIEDSNPADSESNPKTEPTVKKFEKGDMTKAPPWCNFMREHIIPINGWNYKCIGYTPNFEVVLQVVGPTSKTKKKFSDHGLPMPKFPVYPAP